MNSINIPMNSPYTIQIRTEDSLILEDILAQTLPTPQTRIYTLGEKYVYLTLLSRREALLIKLSLGERVRLDKI